MRDYFDKLKAVLVQEQEHRPERQRFVFDAQEGHQNPEWVLAERAAMFEAVNAFRRELGKRPVDMENIYRKETMASGHIDYTRKFALYCAELVTE